MDTTTARKRPLVAHPLTPANHEIVKRRVRALEYSTNVDAGSVRYSLGLNKIFDQFEIEM
jgi:hypothetical protein